MNKLSSPGPGGFGPSFFSTFWDTVAPDTYKDDKLNCARLLFFSPKGKVTQQRNIMLIGEKPRLFSRGGSSRGHPTLIEPHQIPTTPGRRRRRAWRGVP
jgi:hypothetical protein